MTVWLYFLMVYLLSKALVRGCPVTPITVNDSTVTLITSPNYPENYDDSAELCWTISSDGQVSLWVESYEIEDGYDFLSIYDGDSIHDPLLGSLTGIGEGVAISSTGSEMRIKFTSDSSMTEKGFQACVCHHSFGDCSTQCTFLGSFWSSDSGIFRNNIYIIAPVCGVIGMVVAFVVFRIKFMKHTRHTQEISPQGFEGHSFPSSFPESSYPGDLANFPPPPPPSFPGSSFPGGATSSPYPPPPPTFLESSFPGGVTNLPPPPPYPGVVDPTNAGANQGGPFSTLARTFGVGFHR